MGISTKDILFNFLAGGVVVSGTAIIATQVSSKWAALFWSIPLTLVPILIFLHLRKADQKDIAGFVGNVIPGMLVLIGYIIILWLALKKMEFWQAVAVSIAGFILLAVIYWVLVKNNPKIKTY